MKIKLKKVLNFTINKFIKSFYNLFNEIKFFRGALILDIT